MNRIQRLREAKGLSQRELAVRSSVSRGTIACLERPGTMPQLDTAMRIAKALGVDVNDLVPQPVDLDRKIAGAQAQRVLTALRAVGFDAAADWITGATPREIAQRISPASRVHRRMAIGAIEGALEHAECGAHARCSHG